MHPSDGVGRARRGDWALWVVALIGLLLALAGLAFFSADRRAFFVVLGCTFALSGAVAGLLTRTVPPETRNPSSWLWGCMGIALAAIGTSFGWAAASSTAFALPNIARTGAFVVGLALGALAVVLACTARMGRAAAFALALGGLVFGVSAVLVGSNAPFLLRFRATQVEMSGQADTIWGTPPASLRASGRAIPGEPDVPDRIGDFPISQIGVADCGDDHPGEGLSFWLGESSTTTAVWCPIGIPAEGHPASAVRHLGGAWYLEWEGNP